MSYLSSDVVRSRLVVLFVIALVAVVGDACSRGRRQPDRPAPATVTVKANPQAAGIGDEIAFTASMDPRWPVGQSASAGPGKIDAAGSLHVRRAGAASVPDARA